VTTDVDEAGTGRGSEGLHGAFPDLPRT